MTFSVTQWEIAQVVGTALRVDVAGARSDTPLGAFGVEPADWIVIAAALDDFFPASRPHVVDADVRDCVTLGDLVGRVEHSLGESTQRGDHNARF